MNTDNPIVLYEYQKTRNTSHPRESFKELTSEERLKQRQLIVKPLVEAFFAQVKEHQNDVPAKSETGKGLSYCISQEKYLKVFLEDGEVPMDNNAAEQAIRLL